MGESSKTHRIRIFYLGSGEIGVPVLARLSVCPNIILVGCGTQPDQKQGRNQALTPTPVAVWCDNSGIKIEKPLSVNDPKFLDFLRTLDLDIIVVFSYGQILREPILNLPRFGCLNIHASLLPKYRGASPINAAILAGDAVTGVSFMKMEKGLDSGPVYKQFNISISDQSTASDLEEELAQLAAEQICTVIMDVVIENLMPQEQSIKNVTYARKIKKEEGCISWDNEASYVERQVRAFYPWPGTWFFLKLKNKVRKITITSASVKKSQDRDLIAKTILCFEKNKWGIACAKDILEIHRLIPEGKKEMNAEEFYLGNPVETGSIN